MQALIDKIGRDKLFVSNFLTWFAAWGPVVTAIANPVLLDVQYREQHVSSHERKLLVAQEMGKQAINVASMLTLFGVTMLAVPFLLKRYAKPSLQTGKKGKDLKADLESLLTNVTGFVAMTFISPILTPMLLRLWNKNELKKEQFKSTSPRLSLESTAPALPSQPRKPLPVYSQPLSPSCSPCTNPPPFVALPS